MNKTYQDLVAFWNQNFELDEATQKEIKEEGLKEGAWKDLAPSKKQLDVLTSFKGKKNVLDYGCGSGWASIILAKAGVNKVTAVDVASNSARMVQSYAKAYKVEDRIETFPIDETWLSKQSEGSYDGFFSSNVVDVIPLEMGEAIVKEASRVTSEGALVVFSLNYYIDPSFMEKKGHKVEGPHIYINGVLRLTSRSDQEWENLFRKYFKEVSLLYYSWPGEEKETRRLFILKK